MFPTTGPEASFTVVLVAIPVFSASQLLIPMCFGMRLAQEERDRHIRGLAIVWPVLLLGALTLPALARKVRAELGMSGSSSPWFLWIGAAVAGLFIRATAVEAARAARSEVRLRAVAAELLQDAQPLRTSKAADAQSAQNWLDEVQEALDAGRGRTAVRWLRHALRRAEDTADLDAGQGADAIVVPLHRLRQRVDEIDETTGPFSGDRGPRSLVRGLRRFCLAATFIGTGASAFGAVLQVMQLGE
ncbi:hypothetical protein [Streptomyces bicolor]|uniref:hypothetical protein n=1 Tax=Streptomyces bicolor TaxID=66874 RepID=UPI0004E0D705|nr:hypothetical protein [Streptomyces bicolor]